MKRWSWALWVCALLCGCAHLPVPNDLSTVAPFQHERFGRVQPGDAARITMTNGDRFESVVLRADESTLTVRVRTKSTRAIHENGPTVTYDWKLVERFEPSTSASTAEPTAAEKQKAVLRAVGSVTFWLMAF